MSFDARKTLADAGYVAVGLAVLTVQQLDHGRRALAQRLGSQPAFSAVTERLDGAARRAHSVQADVRGRVEPIVERLRGALAA
jgi:hypothetical protein